MFQAAPVFMREQVLQIPGRPTADHVFVHEPVFVPQPPAFEETQIPTRVITAMPDAAAHEDQYAIDVKSVLGHFVRRPLDDGLNITAKLRRDRFVGVKNQDPR